jgi:hypothetical protein
MLSSAAQAVISSITLGPCLAHHIDAAARHRTHEPFALELGKRLTHRRAADPEVRRELPLIEPDVRARAIQVHAVISSFNAA